NEIRSLSRRIDDTRQSGIDSQALAGIERALAEVREVLFSLKPAEQLAGYDEAIRNLHAKLDLILRANDDPSTVHQLEGAIAALRSIVSNVASNDALARLSDDVHMLSAKVDQLAHSSGHNDALALLDQRGAAGNLGRVEDALQDILRHLETQHSNLAAIADNSSRQSFAPPPQMDSGLVDVVKRELSDIRYSQSETDRRTQDALETVHSALGHVVDRLAMIEGDLRVVRSAPPQAVVSPAPAPVPVEPPPAPRLASPPAQPRPEFPN